MKQYQDLLRKVIDQGEFLNDRTGVGTIHTFGESMKFDLNEGFPLLTTKKVFFRGVIEELLWFIKGEMNAKLLQEKGVHIWDEWAREDGDLGPIYGTQWRTWKDYNGGTIDQLQQVIDSLNYENTSRRDIVTAWNPADIKDMALPPCHMMFQCMKSGPFLDMAFYQRSADMFLGVPFNIASYAALLAMIAQQTGLRPRHLTHFIGDCHIYLNHMNQVNQLLEREPKELPSLLLYKQDSINDYKYEHFQLIGYDPYPTIKAPVAV